MYDGKGIASVISTFCLVVLPVVTHAQPVIFEDQGFAVGDIQATVDAFRLALGDNRREINWDVVPDELADPNSLPGDYFNSVLPRGVVLTTPASAGFMVSADSDNPTGTAPKFGSIDSAFTSAFSAFSQDRVFSPVGNGTDLAITDVHFFLPGTSLPATVDAFGAVFSDVETVAETSFSFFDSGGGLIVKVDVPPMTQQSNGSLSFLGVVLETGQHASRVQIVSGSALTTLSQGGYEGVVMDDFIFSEPAVLVAPPVIPEPATVALLTIGALTILGRQRRA